MNPQMTVVFVKSTGHILSVITRSADPLGDISSADLAGPSLMVRFIGDSSVAGFDPIEFDVPPQWLDVLVTDLIPDLLFGPRLYYVDSSKKQVQPIQTAQTITVTPTTSSVKVDLGTPASVDTNVWIAVTGGSLRQPVIAPGTVSATGPDKQTLTFPIGPLAPGNYFVLSLAEGFPLDLQKIP